MQCGLKNSPIFSRHLKVFNCRSYLRSSFQFLIISLFNYILFISVFNYILFISLIISLILKYQHLITFNKIDILKHVTISQKQHLNINHREKNLNFDKICMLKQYTLSEISQLSDRSEIVKRAHLWKFSLRVIIAAKG